MMKKLLALLLCLTLVVASFSAAFMDRDSNTDGTYINLGDKANFNWMHGDGYNDDFKWTISCWVKFNAWPDVYSVIFSTQAGSASHKGVVGMFDASGEFYRIISDGSAVLAGSTVAIDLPIDGDWHHFAWTYDSTPANGNSKIYVDGVLKETANKTANGGNGTSSHYPFISGYTSDLTNIYGGINGYIDDYRIYRVEALDQKAITEIYNGRGTDSYLDLYTNVYASKAVLYRRFMFQEKANGGFVNKVSDSSLYRGDATGGSPSSADLPKSVGSELKFKKARN